MIHKDCVGVFLFVCLSIDCLKWTSHWFKVVHLRAVCLRHIFKEFSIFPHSIKGRFAMVTIAIRKPTPVSFLYQPNNILWNKTCCLSNNRAILSEILRYKCWAMRTWLVRDGRNLSRRLFDILVPLKAFTETVTRYSIVKDNTVYRNSIIIFVVDTYFYRYLLLRTLTGPGHLIGNIWSIICSTVYIWNVNWDVKFCTLSSTDF